MFRKVSAIFKGNISFRPCPLETSKIIIFFGPKETQVVLKPVRGYIILSRPLLFMFAFLSTKAATARCLGTQLPYRGESLVLQKDRANRMIILGCKSSLNHPAAADVRLADDTFDSFPKHSAQVFIIHCAANGHHILLLLCLLVKSSRTSTQFCSRESTGCNATFRRRR